MDMASSSFESLVQPKLADFLPIPNPPFCSEPGSLESLLNGGDSVESLWQSGPPTAAELAAQSDRIGKLLENADVSYMSIRDEFRSANPIGKSQPGTLRAVVEQASPLNGGVFLRERHKRKAAHRAEQSASAVIPSAEDVSTPPLPRGDGEHAQAASTDHAESSRTKLKRRRTQVGRPNQRNLQGPSSGDPVGAFTEFLDDLLQRYDTEEDDGGDGPEVLSSRDLSSLFGEIVKLRDESQIQAVPLQILLKTMKHLDQCIKAGTQAEINDEQDDPEANSKIMQSLEAIQVAITIMSAPNMPNKFTARTSSKILSR